MKQVVATKARKSLQIEKEMTKGNGERRNRGKMRGGEDEMR
jgi:hypothetical protein